MSEHYRMGEEDAAQQLVRKHQITTVRYKVYLFFMGVFLFMFEPTLTGMVEQVRGEGAFSFSFSNPVGIFTELGEGGLLNEVSEVEKNIEETQNEIQSVKVEKKVVELLSEKEKQNTIINCLNNEVCDSIDPKLMQNIKFLRVYLMMNYLGGEKMDFDQKTLLRSINEYINKTPGGLTNGVLQGIRFSDPIVVDAEYKINSLKIVLNMEFDHKRNLNSFLENMEDKVFSSLPLLYVIDSLNYDIVNYTERQAISITTTVYYFDGKPPELEIGEGNEGVVDDVLSQDE